MKREHASPDADVTTSKFLSLVLRHKPETVGLSLDDQGWADIDALLRCSAAHGRAFSRSDLMRVVEQSDKKRFALSGDGLRIRAVQGHSAKEVDIDFVPQIPPDTLFHGTAGRFLESIRAQGLVPGQRQYVHLCADPDTARKVGARHGKPVTLTIRAATMCRDGFAFYRADNGVWLTRQVPAGYIEEGDKG